METATLPQNIQAPNSIYCYFGFQNAHLWKFKWQFIFN